MSLRRIVHPLSFYLTLVVITVTASLVMVWSIAHVVGLVMDLGLIIGLRELALWEGRHGVETSRHSR